MSQRLPLPLLLAPLAPTVLLAAFEAGRELRLWPGVDLATALLLWLFATLPLALLVLGLRRMQPRRPEAVTDETRGAFEAVARAEQTVAAASATLQSAQVAFARIAEGRAGDVKPRSRAPVWAALGLAFVLASGGLAYAITQGERLPVHIHAGFALFVDGDHLAFLDPAFDVRERGIIRGHVHVADNPPGILHLEGRSGDDFPLAQALRDAVSVNITDDAMVLDEIAHHNRSLTSQGDARLQLFVAHDAGATWEPVWPIASYHVKNRDRVLLTFGAPTDEELQAQLAAVPWRIP